MKDQSGILKKEKEYDLRYAETRLRAHDGEELFVRHYAPADGESPRTLLIVHGASEHGGRYEHVARKFVDEGWNVIVGDHRGHGQSGGVPVFVNHFNEYIHDLELIRSHFGLVPQRTALLGHSMGGLVATRYIQSLPDNVAALVLISPLFGVGIRIPRSTLALGRLLTVFHPRFRFRSLVDPYDTTRNEPILNVRLKDPLMHQTVTAGWFFAMRKALQSAWEQADAVNLPLLVMQAGADRIVCPRAAESWQNLVTSSDKTFRLLPDHLHEVLNEPNWQQSTSEILDWLNERIVDGEDISDLPSPKSFPLTIEK